jgi:hypothetical protein
MPIAALPETLDRLLAYLARSGGSDRFEFHDFRGEPDPLAAREFAEALRQRFAAHLGEELAVQQIANRVIVTVLDAVRV